MNRALLAFHEAGHTLAAIVCELDLEYVTIEQTIIDGTILDGHTKTSAPFNITSAREYGVFYLAGLIAERKYATGETGFSEDWKQTETEFDHAGYDLPRLEKALTWYPNEALATLTSQIIETCWPVIELIAERLQVECELSAESVEVEIEDFADEIEEAKRLAGM